MRHIKIFALAALAALACSGAAVAAPPHWTFAEGGLSTGDGNQVNDTSFFSIGGSLAVKDIWHVRGRWATGESAANGGRDVSNFELGGGMNRQVNGDTDLVLDVFFGNIDEDDAGGLSVESDYFGYSLGIRSQLTDQFEFDAAMIYADVDCPAGCGGATSSAVNVGGVIGGRYFIDDKFSVGASLNWGGMLGDLLTLNVRWAFDDAL